MYLADASDGVASSSQEDQVLVMLVALLAPETMAYRQSDPCTCNLCRTATEQTATFLLGAPGDKWWPYIYPSTTTRICDPVML